MLKTKEVVSANNLPDDLLSPQGQRVKPGDQVLIKVGTIPEDKCCVVWRTQPNSTGTFYTAMMEGAWWLCGHSLWPVLPSNWTGRCAPIAVSDHTYIVPVGAVQSAHTHKKRSQQYHVCVRCFSRCLSYQINHITF
uniref:Uncharacterized protein n=1 Tax=Mastacembelus armatus TaxID=205130 RepID=A0A3Q3RK90_9TELE